MTESNQSWSRRGFLGALAATSAVLATGCAAGGSPASTASVSPFQRGVLDKSRSGEEIIILMPSWADMATDKYAEFTALTGISVKTDFEDFDQVHDKIVTACSAKTSPGDIIEVDSLWLGQFGKAGWLAPVDDLLAADTLSAVGAKSLFAMGGRQLAMPYALDFRWIAVNMTLLNKAGITAKPTSWSTFKAAAIALKSHGVCEFPIGEALAASAETVEPWLNLTVMNGGAILGTDGKPAFAQAGSPGNEALAFLADCYLAGLINPAAVNMNGEQIQQEFAAGRVAFDMRNGPSIVYNDPKQSKVAGDNIQHMVIGKTEVAKRVYGLPEAMGIPTFSKHKEAAAMFITWYNQPAQEQYMYSHQIPGVLPAQPAALQALAAAGKIPDGQAVLEFLPDVVPLFEQGAPTWWPDFANNAAKTVQSAVTGKAAVQQALDDLAVQTNALIAK